MKSIHTNKYKTKIIIDISEYIVAIDKDKSVVDIM